MQIQFTGLNMEVTAALKTFTENKFERLEKLADNITSVQITFDVDKLRQIVEAKLHIPGSEIHARAESENMYKAIDALISKLTTQIKKHKEKVTDHR